MHYGKSIDPGKENRTAQRQATAERDDACRCKETSAMTPGQLLKLMMRDLAFWKKEKEKDPKTGLSQSRQARKG